jgi:hypothetical protein
MVSEYTYRAVNEEDLMAAPAAGIPRLQPAAPAASATRWAPTTKVAVGALAGSFTIIIVQVLQHYGFQISAEAGGAITTLVTFVIQYFTPEQR